MNPHELAFLHILHVFSVLVVAAFTFLAFAAPPDTRKRVLAVTGVASLLVLVTGLRMWQGLYGFQMLGWILIKLVCWIGLAALSGLAYRKRDQAATLMLIGLLLLVTAVAMVYVKPF